MTDTPTTNYGLNVPTDGADDDVWGVLTNENWAILDAALKVIEDKADAALVRAQVRIGEIYGTTEVGSPDTFLGYGVWEAFALNNTLVGAGDAYALGDTGGSSVHTLTAAQAKAQAHGHADTIAVVDGGGHQHTPESGGNFIVTGGIGGVSGFAFGGNYDPTYSTGLTNANGGVHAHSVSGGVTNSADQVNDAHNNMQPYVAINYWKRTA